MKNGNIVRERMPKFSATKGAVLGAALLVAGSVPALATPLSFTWNPSGSTPALSTQGAFTADNIDVKDTALITITPTSATAGTFTESGILAVSDFSNLGTIVNVPSLGTSPYAIYFTFSATGNLSGLNTSAISGSFSTLTYTMLGSVNNGATLTAGNSTTAPSLSGGTMVTLATGSLVSTQLLQINSDIPAADVISTFVPDASQGGFFVAPGLISLHIDAFFGNTAGQVVKTALGNGDIDYKINGGGGNADFLVPEPASMLLFGAGLLGLGVARRRRAKSAG